MIGDGLMEELATQITTAVRPKPADIPKYIANGAARATLHAMQRHFNDPAVMADYEKWLKKQKTKETE
jgi:hypothetical protein